MHPLVQGGRVRHHGGMPFWIDTHCHLDAAEFAADRDAVRQRAAAAGVAHCVIPAVERANGDAVRQLAHRQGDSYALGIHPLYTAQATDADRALLAQALEQHRHDPRLVAIGEIGLDFFVAGLDPARQEQWYRAQLQLARRFDLPVILHVRRSADKLLKGLRDIAVPGGPLRGGGVKPVRRDIRRVGLHHQGRFGQLGRQPAQLQRPVIGHGAAKPQLEAQCDEGLGLLQTAVEGMGDAARHGNVAQPLEELVRRAAHMQDHRQIEPSRQLQLGTVELLLPRGIEAID